MKMLLFRHTGYNNLMFETTIYIYYDLLPIGAYFISRYYNWFIIVIVQGRPNFFGTIY